MPSYKVWKAKIHTIQACGTHAQTYKTSRQTHYEWKVHAKHTGKHCMVKLTQHTTCTHNMLTSGQKSSDVVCMFGPCRCHHPLLAVITVLAIARQLKLYDERISTTAQHSLTTVHAQCKHWTLMSTKTLHTIDASQLHDECYNTIAQYTTWWVKSVASNSTQQIWLTN